MTRVLFRRGELHRKRRQLMDAFIDAHFDDMDERPPTSEERDAFWGMLETGRIIFEERKLSKGEVAGRMVDSLTGRLFGIDRKVEEDRAAGLMAVSLTGERPDL